MIEKYSSKCSSVITSSPLRRLWLPRIKNLRLLQWMLQVIDRHRRRNSMKKNFKDYKLRKLLPCHWLSRRSWKSRKTNNSKKQSEQVNKWKPKKNLKNPQKSILENFHLFWSETETWQTKPLQTSKTNKQNWQKKSKLWKWTRCKKKMPNRWRTERNVSLNKEN